MDYSCPYFLYWSMFVWDPFGGITEMEKFKEGNPKLNMAVISRRIKNGQKLEINSKYFENVKIPIDLYQKDRKIWMALSDKTILQEII